MADGSTLARSIAQPLRALDAREKVKSWVGHRFDLGVRLALRALFVRRGVPFMTPQELERSLAMLRPYTDPAVLADPDRLMAPADAQTAVRTLWRKPVRGGTHAHLTFQSPYQPIHPVYAAEFRRYDRLDTVHLFAWQHVKPAPASILLTHGWGAGPKSIHEREFGIPFLFRALGLDVYYYVAPFHWLRKPTRARFSGELHPSPNLMRTNEAFIQTAREIRTAIGVIKAHNEAPLGMMGSSLGGYTTALIASIDSRLDFAVPVLPPASLADLFWAHGENDPVRKKAESMGMTKERFRDAWALHSPLSHTPKVPWHGRLIVTAAGDALVPPSYTAPLIEHWEHPRQHVFAGGHILQIDRHRYHRELGSFLGELGCVSSDRLERAGLLR